MEPFCTGLERIFDVSSVVEALDKTTFSQLADTKMEIDIWRAKKKQEEEQQEEQQGQQE